jgi:hypothetical protein
MESQSEAQSKKQVLQTKLQGKVGTLGGFFEFDFGFIRVR